MPVHLLEITVRPDWQTLSRRMAAQRMRLWRATEAAVAAATMLVLIIGLVWTASPWTYLARTLLYTGVFWLFPLAFIYRSRLSTGRIELQLADAVTLLAVAAGVAFVSSPYFTSTIQAPALAFLALAIPLITLPWLARTTRRFPAPARQLGLIRDQWPVFLLIGAAAGLAIGFHLLITSKTLLAAEPQPALTAVTLLWLVCLRVGLTALGEELFFRGWCYHLLVQQTRGSIWSAAAKITLLNLLVYAVYATSAPSVAIMAWVLAYGALVAFACTLLRHHFHSLLPGLACNVVASLFLVMLTGV